jgi:sugar lactone lactonase YvrE
LNSAAFCERGGYEEVDPMAELSVLADYKDRCGEGPLWDVQHKRLYWTDCLGLRFYRYNWHSKKHEIVMNGFEIKGFALNEDGGFVISNTSGIWFWDGSGTPRVVCKQADGYECQANDCIADPAGRLLAGLFYYDAGKNYPLGKLIAVHTDGKAHVLDEGFHLSNGLGFSPDCRTLYFTDSVARCIFAYDYDAAMGAVKNRRIFVKVPATSGIPDGLTVDADGYVWSAEWYGSCIVRYDPDGVIERRINTPAKQTSSIAFGGPDLSEIFITSAGESAPLPVMPPGYDPLSGYFGGALYNMKSEIQGKPEFRTNIRLE